MIQFNVIIWDFNERVFKPYDIIPYLIECYNKTKTKPKTFNQFKKFIKEESLYQWWARCEYEIILMDWPCQETTKKWDIYKQIMMNIDIITKLIMEEVNK